MVDSGSKIVVNTVPALLQVVFAFLWVAGTYEVGQFQA